MIGGNYLGLRLVVSPVQVNLIHLVLVFGVVYFILVHVGECRRSGSVHTDRVSVTGAGNGNQGNMVVTDVTLDAVKLHAPHRAARPFNVASVAARERTRGAVFHGVDSVLLCSGQRNIDPVRIGRNIGTHGTHGKLVHVLGRNGFFGVQKCQRLKAERG